MTYRSMLVIGLCLNCLVSQGQAIETKNNEQPVPIILFICEHGAGMSPIATAYFNKIAKEKGLNAQAVFRGINTDSVLGPAIQKGLLKDSFDITGWQPKPLSEQDTENAYKIVTLNCSLPTQNSATQRSIRWSNIPISEGYVPARDDIEKRVTELVESWLFSDIDGARKFSGSGHIMGTCRMGKMANTSVVDENCRTHDHNNLYIADSSVFTTGSTANPTLTTAAISLRVADKVYERLQPNSTGLEASKTLERETI